MPGANEGDGTRLSKPVLEYVERFASVLVAAGFPGMSARVMAALHVSDSGRLTSAELGEMLQISPAAVSGAVRYLMGLGLVHRERVPGSRRDYYRMPPNVWEEVVRMQSQVLMRWAKILAEGVDVVGPATPAGERMAEFATFFGFVNREFPGLIERWEAHRETRPE
ncbi:MAG TPA: MarR family transcriptional regulator [Trebonia sp.]|nr:MarR family transcriptional regulator [Trebonia sp.]